MFRIKRWLLNCGEFKNILLLIAIFPQSLTDSRLFVKCTVIFLVPDLAQWTVDDVKAWLLWTLRQYNLPMIHMEYFNMDGVALSALSEEEFQKRAPEVSLGITIQSRLN